MKNKVKNTQASCVTCNKSFSQQEIETINYKIGSVEEDPEKFSIICRECIGELHKANKFIYFFGEVAFSTMDKMPFTFKNINLNLKTITSVDIL